MDNEEQYVQALEKFGDHFVSREDPEVGSAFLRFTVFTKELTALFKNLVRSSFVCSSVRQSGVLVSDHFELQSLPVCRCRT